MLKTVKDACNVFPTTLDYQVAGGVERLAQVLESEDGGKAALVSPDQSWKNLWCKALRK